MLRPDSLNNIHVTSCVSGRNHAPPLSVGLSTLPQGASTSAAATPKAERVQRARFLAEMDV